MDRACATINELFFERSKLLVVEKELVKLSSASKKNTQTLLVCYMVVSLLA
jgi:hypothetical protein